MWLPVLLGLGIGIYFSLRHEPVFWQALVAMLASLVMWLVMRHRDLPGKMVVAGLVLTLGGFVVADLRTQMVRAPILAQETRLVLVEGVLRELEEGARGRRLTIAPDSIETLTASELPALVRVSWRGAGYVGRPGDTIRILAILAPPPDPVAPGSYDFARQLYFERIGAVGYGVRAPEIIATPARPGFASRIERARLAIGARIRLAIGPERSQIAAVCVALVTGKREGVSDDTQAALRDAGLAHLLAISGLHMGLVAGLLFFCTRFLLACVPWLALHYPIKKWAAGAALLGAFSYLLISGGAWSTRRAFIMAAVFFIAIIVDRRAISLRNVMIAATILLLLTPEALFQAGFQMSFAAVTVLIAAYEWYERRGIFTSDELLAGSARRGRVRQFLTYMTGLAATSVLAGLATAPFALFHFNRYASYGLAGNMLAMPLMVFITMPAAIAGFVLIPTGLDIFAWRLMGLSVEYILAAGRMVSSWGQAVIHIADIGFPAFASVVLAGLIFTLLRTPLRLAGFAPLVLAFGLAGAAQTADIIIGREGRNMAFLLEGENGKQLSLYSLSTERFAARNWLAAAGQSENLVGLADIGDLGKARHEAVVCKLSGCLVTLKNGTRLAISEALSGLLEDCRSGDIIVARYRVPTGAVPECEALLIDQAWLAGTGALAIYLPVSARQPIRIKAANMIRGNRPWAGAVAIPVETSQ